MASAEREPMMGFGALPELSPGLEPLISRQGTSTLKLKVFSLGRQRGKFAPFLLILGK